MALSLLLNKRFHVRLNEGMRGFTLIEILLAFILLGAIMATILSMMNITSKLTSTSKDIVDANSRIDADLAVIRRLAETYTCCPGSCTTNSTTISASSKCIGVSGTDSRYYLPQSLGATADPRGTIYNSDLNSFITSCGTSLLTNLITSINSINGNTSSPRVLSIRGSQSFVNVSATVDDLASNRILIVYTGSGNLNGINRVVKLVPAVANWCP